jgi:hypothetical protein
MNKRDKKISDESYKSEFRQKEKGLPIAEQPQVEKA